MSDVRTGCVYGFCHSPNVAMRQIVLRKNPWLESHGFLRSSRRETFVSLFRSGYTFIQTAIKGSFVGKDTKADLALPPTPRGKEGGTRGNEDG